MYATFWALVPPIIAITLALITKEVYSSLFVGIVVGGMFYSGFQLEGTLNHILNDGFIAALSDPGHVGVLFFVVVLMTLVSLMNKTGGSAAFGRWAQRHIKSRAGAQLATVLLGMLIFVDDGFNCMTVGSVMRPLTDQHRVSRAKLAYLIDATAAPVCIIAPISSWAAAVTGFVDGEDGLSLFIRAIPYNYYALLTLAFMAGAILLKTDFGPMSRFERIALDQGNLFGESGSPVGEDYEIKGKGTVIDLVLPIVILITGCVLGMAYTGGFFSGVSFAQSLAQSNAAIGLSMGSLIALLITFVFYLSRRVLSFRDCMDCLPEGFKSVVPPMLILIFAWTLKSMTDSLGAAEYVAAVVERYADGFQMLLPAIIFVIAVLLSFATGTSWGTFGILIPIVVGVFSQTDYTMMTIAISACLAGSVCGDHCSPISDTTIMSSAGAQCSHVDHVSTQMPYAAVVAAISFVTYLVAGAVHNPVICLAVGIALTVGVLAWIKMRNQSRSKGK